VSSTKQLARVLSQFVARLTDLFNSLFGFLLGCTLSGGSVYGYLLKEYKTANDLLSEDIYALQTAVSRLSTYVQTLEEKKK
jgi:hypothetical protein